MAKRTVHIEDLFTVDNAISGMWYEPKLGKDGCGFEFLICGATTDEAMADDEHYESLYAQAEEIKDPIQRKAEQMKVDAERCARLVKGIRAAEGCEVDFNGKSIEYTTALVEQIFLKSPDIKKDVVRFATNNLNFIKRERNA